MILKFIFLFTISLVSFGLIKNQSNISAPSKIARLRVVRAAQLSRVLPVLMGNETLKTFFLRLGVLCSF